MPSIQLTKGYVALIDDEDADLMAHGYYAAGGPKVYAQRYIRGSKPKRCTYLHRDIAERLSGPIPKGYDVDHINGDTMDNRRSNLRVVTHRRNVWNQSGASRNSKTGFRGVMFRDGKYKAYICEGTRKIMLGRFDTIEAAYAARLAAERERELSIAA